MSNKTPLRILITRSARWLVPVVYLVSAVAFILDLLRDNTLAYGIIYTPLIATAVFHRGRAGLWILSLIGCAMVIIGALVPVVDADLPDLIGNRLLSILAILATAAFVHHARDIQERLSNETRRAEAAERIKTDVLRNVSEEIRTPLHSLLAMLTLTMVDSKPAQRETLGRVNSDGRQLLATIDNLIDLSQIEARELQQETINVTTVVRQAAANAGLAARERQITVALIPEGGAREVFAVGDSWAVRRILDNLLANAVRLTPPGGAISVSVDRHEDTVTASVSDTGNGLPAALAQDFHAAAPANDTRSLSASGGVGLALSSRLAVSMNGKVTARNQPGSGAVVSLSLPAA